MIKTDAAYDIALQQLKRDRDAIAERERKLKQKGLSREQIARAMAPQYTLYEQLREEVQWYEKARRGDIQVATTFRSIGRLLIALRIACAMSQRELAEALGVDESQISRDEKNEYHGITVTRADQILSTLKGKLEITVQPEPELVAS